MSPSDLQNIQSSNFFVLTAAQIGHYNLTYAGRQKVDEVDCYVFDVTPRVLEKKHRYFNGRIWVATAGLQIVVTQGRMVSAVARKRISIRLSLHGANRLTALLVPRLRARRRHVALHRWPRLHASKRAYSRHHQVHRLQAVQRDGENLRRRSGHYAAGKEAGEVGSGKPPETGGSRLHSQRKITRSKPPFPEEMPTEKPKTSMN